MANTNGTDGTNVISIASAKKMLRGVSDILGRMAWTVRAGLTHEGSRDLWTVFGYKRELTSQDLFVKFRRQDIARTIVHAPADAIWTRPPVLQANSDFLEAYNAIVKEHNLYSVLNRVDLMLGWSRYAIIVIGLNDGRKLNEPVRSGASLKVTYLQPYSELGVKIDTWETDPASPRFGKPLMYSIALNETEQTTSWRYQLATNSPSATFQVHWSRVVHIAGDVIEDTVFGIPRLEPVYNLLDDLLKIMGGSAETYWLTANRGMQVDVDKEMQLGEDDAEALAAEIDEYYHNLRRFIKTRGVKINELGSKVSDPTTSVTTQLSVLAASARIPQRLLMGSEAGQLASEQDRANWAERVNERRNAFAEPYALTPMITRFVHAGICPEPGDIIYQWPDAFILGPLERAQTSAQKARSAANLSKVLVEQQNARAPIPDPSQIVSTGGFGGFRANAEDEPKPNGNGDGGNSDMPADNGPTVTTVPLIQQELASERPFITVDEARAIVGFMDETPILEDRPVEPAGITKRPT